MAQSVSMALGASAVTIGPMSGARTGHEGAHRDLGALRAVLDDVVDVDAEPAHLEPVEVAGSWLDELEGHRHLDAAGEDHGPHRPLGEVALQGHRLDRRVPAVPAARVAPQCPHVVCGG